LYLVMLFLLVTSMINTMVLYRLANMNTSIPPPPVPSLPPLNNLPKDQSGWLDLLTKQTRLHSVRSSHLRQQLLTATEHIARAEEALEQLRQGLESWGPYGWLEEESNCVIRDGKTICDLDADAEPEVKDPSQIVKEEM